MQLMARTSVEGAGKDEVVQCLGLIPTDITPLQANGLRLPHMGWNTLTQVSDHAIFKGISADDYFYFVHSFAAPISEYTVARCQYGSEFSAAIAKDNFIGCQFHPERSSALGSKIIKNFLEM
jgi:glutamine amidotransferase